MKQQNTEKLSDKAFARLILTSILGILVCIVCLCSTTYAWFTDSAQGDSNKIQTASECSFSAAVYKDDAETPIATVDTQNAVTLTCEEGTYTVTLMLPKESASGYLVLTVNGTDRYSDHLQRNDEADQTLTFTLEVKTEQSVTFTARWGIHSQEPQIKSGGTLEIA